MKIATLKLVRIEKYQGDGYVFFDGIFQKNGQPHIYRSRFNEANISSYKIGDSYNGTWNYSFGSCGNRVFHPKYHLNEVA